jgi:3'(2'), 5'-bisphosphate nucleotidase
VDPLDGTKEFIKRNGEFTVNIALIEGAVPVFGVVYAPVLQTIYYGVLAEGEKHGAWSAGNCEGKSVDEILAAASPCAMHLAPCSKPLRVVASKSHSNEETEAFIAALESEYGAVERVSRGSSLKLCMVAEGSADIYPRIAPTMEWDTAAAQAVVTAAGGQVYQYSEGLPASVYVSGMRKVESNAVPPESAASDTREKLLHPLQYNKENLLNPAFVVSRFCSL